MGTPRMPRFDVTIAGELNLDLILYGLPDELPPERELLADRMMLTLGGSSSIVAHNLAALGSHRGTLLGRSRFGLPHRFATLSFVVVLSAACLTAPRCRVASEDESIRADRFSGHE